MDSTELKIVAVIFPLTYEEGAEMLAEPVILVAVVVGFIFSLRKKVQD